MKQPQRKFVVFLSLVSVLGLTGGLLLALAPAPLAPEAAGSLFAANTAPQSMDVIFNTEQAVQPGRWSHIYIHHSRTTRGDAWSVADPVRGLGDHFVIGNGDGAADGEIQIGYRWSRQESATAPAGANHIDPKCISICLIGDFDHARPTPTQERRLAQLVNTLQDRLGIAPEQVLAVVHADSPAGIGQHFPLESLRQQLLPAQER